MSQQPNHSSQSSQRDLIEGGQQMIQKTIELPVNQAVEFQRNMARMFLTGLEVQQEAQQQGVELLKDSLNNYLETVESTAEGVGQTTEESVQAAMGSAQQLQTEMGTPPSQGSRSSPTQQQPPTTGQVASRGREPMAYYQSGISQQPPAGQQIQDFQQPQTQQYQQPQTQGFQQPQTQGFQQPQTEHFQQPQTQQYEQPQTQQFQQPQTQQYQQPRTQQFGEPQSQQIQQPPAQQGGGQQQERLDYQQSEGYGQGQGYQESAVPGEQEFQQIHQY